MNKISIHALRVEGDLLNFFQSARGIRTFLSTPSGWRATNSALQPQCTYTVFLSTPSGWRATRSILSGSKVSVFLSTPSGWRATRAAHIGLLSA